MPGLLEEMKKKVNRPVPELLPIAEDNEVVEVEGPATATATTAAPGR